MLKGSKMTPEQIKRLRSAHLGKTPWNKGVPMSKEQKLKLIGLKHSEATKAKLRLHSARKGTVGTMLGKHLTTEQKKKVSESSKRFWSDPEYRRRQSEIHKGKTNPNKGKTFPEWSGENSPHWKGGISFEPYPLDWTRTLKRSIRERDHYDCRLCSSKNDMDLHIHHIDYDKNNCNPDNLITLCNGCHSKTNHTREYWKNFFSQLIKNSI